MRRNLAQPLAPVALAFLAASSSAQLGSQQLARVYPSPNGLAQGDAFAHAVDVDGPRLVAGAPGHDPNGASDGGAVYVFDLVGGSLIQTGELLSSSLDGGDRCGYAVSLEGDTLVAGAPFDEEGTVAAAGSAVVFTLQGGLWLEQARLLAADLEQIDQFGTSVALDGDTLLVGAPFKNGAAGLDAGAAYVFVRTGTQWTQEAKLTAAGGAAGDRFGQSVAVDGDRAVVGAPGAGGGAGAVFVFARAAGSWAEVAALASGDPDAGDGLGEAVAIDAGTLIAGAPHDDGAGSGAGAAYVFVDGGTGWVQEAKLTDFGFVFVDQFGTAVDVEGDRAVVGLPYSNVGGLATGAVQLFTRTGGLWTGALELIGGDSDPNDFLGSSVGLSGDLVVGGAPTGETPPSGQPTGEAYLFAIVPPPLVETYCTAKTNSQGCLPSMSWTGSPSASNPGAFEVRCVNVVNFKSGLLFYGYASLAAPFQGGLKCVAAPVRRTPVQNSLGSQPPAADCTGTFSYDMNARIQSGADPNLVPGVDVYGQYWMRDPASASTTGLSDGLHFRIVP